MQLRTVAPPPETTSPYRSIRPRLKRAGLLLAAALLVAAPGRPAAAASADPTWGEHGMVVSSQADAARAGASILAAGGNAVDAAVATAFAISVTQPYSTGLGGGGFVLIRLSDGRVVAIDCRETAPGAADRDMYVREGVAPDASVKGPLAAGTPGLVAGLTLALQQFGTLPLETVMQPAIRLAADGFAIGPYHARMIEYMRQVLPADRYPETARIQFPPDGVVARPGWRLVQTDLARTLRAVAAHGNAGFYAGPVAQAISKWMRENGGLITAADLVGYAPALREPLVGTYRAFTIHSFPPPSSGGVALIESLNILEGFDLAKRGAGSSASLHVISEALKLAFADRASFLGDPDFVDVPVDRLIDKEYAAELRARINPPWWRRAPWHWGQSEWAIHVKAPGQPVDDSGTTHLSVSDDAGNAVGITLTINTPYGSGITIPGTGVIMNNEMDDFAKAPNTPNVYGLIDTRGANAIAPGKRPLSSMTPTIVTFDGRLFMVTGSPGGPRIISTVLESILNVVDYQMDVKAAVSTPRFHHQWVPDKITVEPEIPDDVVEGLRRRGHQVEVSERDWSAAEAIVLDPVTGWHLGGSDPRTDGAAVGVP